MSAVLLRPSKVTESGHHAAVVKTSSSIESMVQSLADQCPRESVESVAMEGMVLEERVMEDSMP